MLTVIMNTESGATDVPSYPMPGCIAGPLRIWGSDMKTWLSRKTPRVSKPEAGNQGPISGCCAIEDFD